MHKIEFLGVFSIENDPKKVYNLIEYHIYNLELIDMSKFIYQLAVSMYNSKTWTNHLSQLCSRFFRGKLNIVWQQYLSCKVIPPCKETA